MKDGKTTLIYVTRDIERALGTTPSENFLIVSNKTKYGETIKKKYPDFVFLVESPGKDLLGTTELLEHETTKKLVSNNASPQILVFKNTLRVESVIKNNSWKVVNPPSNLSERVENKLSQLRWLGALGAKYLPSHTAKMSKEIKWRNDPIVIQWAHGHTGDGTILVRTPVELYSLQEKFPMRMARLSTYISGPSFTVNAVVAKNRILMSNVSYQITGMAPFTDNEFSTIGNDWSLPKKILGDADMRCIRTIVNDVGNKLHGEGWRGLFGVDFIQDEETKKIYLIEINARQPASTTFESFLQEKAKENGAPGLTAFEAHLRALSGEDTDDNLIEISDGAQVIQRITKNIQGVFDDVGASLQSAGYTVIAYENSAYNSDLLRIQSADSIMDGHAILNSKGKEIAETIKSSKFNIQI